MLHAAILCWTEVYVQPCVFAKVLQAGCCCWLLGDCNQEWILVPRITLHPIDEVRCQMIKFLAAMQSSHHRYLLFEIYRFFNQSAVACWNHRWHRGEEKNCTREWHIWTCFFIATSYDVGAINRLAASARETATFYIPNSIKPICHSPLSYGVEMQIKSLIIWEDANCLFHPPPIANWLRWGTFVAPYWKFEDFHLPGFKGINFMGSHGTAGTEIPIRTLLYWFWITYNYHNLQKLILSSLCYPRRNCPPRHL